MVSVLFSALTAAGSDSPVGPIRRTTSGDTGSLKLNLKVAGASASVTPSGGSDPTSEACAKAGQRLRQAGEQHRQGAARQGRADPTVGARRPAPAPGVAALIASARA